MEKFLSGGGAYVLTLIGLVLAVTVGVMSILLPMVVLRIMAKVSAINTKMDTIITLLANVAAEANTASPQRHEEERRHASVALKGPAADGQGRSLRYK